MATRLERLAVALWRGHAKALHSAMHGKESGEALELTDAGFDKQYGPMKAAWVAGARELLEALKRLGAGTCILDEVLAEPGVTLPPAPAPEPTADEPAAKPAINSNPTGIPGGAHLA